MRRKLHVLLLLIFICNEFVFAQTPVADSLRKLILAHAQEDTVKINLLNQLSVQLRRPQPKTSDSMINIAISLSERLNYPKGKGNALTVKAVRLYDNSDFLSATKTFEEAKQLLESANDIHGLAYFFRMRANLLMDEGDYAQSLDDFLHGLKLAEEVGDIRQAVEVNRTIGYLYNVIGDYEKAIPYQTDALRQAESIGYKLGISGAYNAIGKTYKTQGNYPASLDAYIKGLRIDEELKDSTGITVDYSNIGDVYERMGNYKEAFAYLRPAWSYWMAKPKNTLVPWDEWAMGKAFTHSGNADSGLHYAKHAYLLSQQLGWRLYLREITFLISESAAKLKQWDTAYKYAVLSSNLKDTLTGQETARKTAMLQAGYDLDKKQAEIALLTKDKQLQAEEYRRERGFLYGLLGGLVMLIALAVLLYRNNRNKQKANILLQTQKEEIDKKAHELSVQKDYLEQSYANVELLGEIGRKITSSLSVGTIIGTVYDKVNSMMDASVFGIGIYDDEGKKIDFPATYEKGEALSFYSNSIYDKNRFASLCFESGKEIVISDLENDYQEFLQEIPKSIQGERPVSLIYLPLRIKSKTLGVITVQSFRKDAYSDYHIYMLRNIAIYAAIALENADSYERLNQTIDSLKKTQKQLIQSEKMASLGELTAGIAHEIQNPLNFVNNFSEINKELLIEMKEEIKKGNMSGVTTIADNIIENEEKINVHGKRADSIVKGMLQHSRSSSGTKESTDINTLADEYFRLAYHGLRAKDKSFNATMRTEYDESVGRVNIIPQDIGRVILNLITNAFYAVTEKVKQQQGEYKPTVCLSTYKRDGKILIAVKDNGNGIPQKIKDKIFQPFFTTKPSGQGTGLGLSMSYDIVTRGHGGELKLESVEGSGAEFIIVLPI
jgi:signal transduction histidine kinase